MSIRLLVGDEPLPAPENADPTGLVAVGGDLRPERLLEAYQRGIFPWYEEGLPILWHSPDPRMVLEPTQLRVNRSLAKRVRRGEYQVSFDRSFPEVIRACAQRARPGQSGTWITSDMQRAYVRLHQLGHAHSVEAWHEGTLVGGLYGVSAGGVFCGESMFATRSDASKVAFVWAVRQLQRWGVRLIDCQVHTEHLEALGGENWSRDRFLTKLAQLRELPLEVGRWSFDADFDPLDV